MMRSLFRRFRTREDAGLSVETVLMFPMLMWAYGAMFVFWDAFAMRNDAIAATYTLADLLSRQTASVDDDFVDGMHSLFEVLLGNVDQTQIRVSVVEMVQGSDPAIDPPVLELRWSETAGGMLPHQEIESLANSVPEMAVGASLIVVETKTDWSPPLNMGLGPQQMNNFVFTSPRFVPQITFDAS